MRRFVLANEAERLGLVNCVVPAAELERELMDMARIIAEADGFHLQMMKLACNQAQDAAGMTTHVRASLSMWTAYRWDWTQKAGQASTADHGGSSKKLAPVDHAAGPGPMRWSDAANGKSHKVVSKL